MKNQVPKDLSLVFMLIFLDVPRKVSSEVCAFISFHSAKRHDNMWLVTHYHDRIPLRVDIAIVVIQCTNFDYQKRKFNSIQNRDPIKKSPVQKVTNKLDMK